MICSNRQLTETRQKIITTAGNPQPRRAGRPARCENIGVIMQSTIWWLCVHLISVTVSFAVQRQMGLIPGCFRASSDQQAYYQRCLQL